MKKYIRKTFRRKFTKSGEVYIDSIVKIIICVVVGALLLGALVSVASGTLQTAKNEIDDMLNINPGDATISSNPTESEEISIPDDLNDTSAPEEPQYPESPIISTQPQPAEYYENDEAENLSVEALAPDGGTLSYQWQRSPDGGSWDDIAEATLPIYTPDTSIVSLYKYRCKVTNTKGSQSASVTTDIVMVKINAALVTTSYNLSFSQTFTIQAEPSQRAAYSLDEGATWTNINGELKGQTVGEGASIWIASTAPIGTITYSINEGTAQEDQVNKIFDDNLTVQKITLSGEYADEPGSEVGDFTYGDVNGDGHINVQDFILAKLQALDTHTLTPTQFAAADINGDGYVTDDDAEKIRKHVLGLINLNDLYKLGDANGDGKIDTNDYVSIGLHLTGTKPLIGRQLVAADINKNGTVDEDDREKLRLYLYGLYDF